MTVEPVQGEASPEHALFHKGERVIARDRVWIIKEEPEGIGGDRVYLKLQPADSQSGRPLEVIIPPERVGKAENEKLVFDRRLLGPLQPLVNKIRAISTTSVKAPDLLSGARYCRVQLEAYQIQPVLQALGKPRPRLLIADDVGLGKTIEAGLCMLELMARGRARRVLVVVPPGLIDQWHDELLDKFGLDFTVIGNMTDLSKVQMTLPAGVNPWTAKNIILTSVDYLKKTEVFKRALSRTWDLVIVDEAHGLSEGGTPKSPQSTRRTRLGQQLRKRCNGLLLLTATPHNGFRHSFRSLVELVEPSVATLIGDPDKVARRIGYAMVRRMKRQILANRAGIWQPAFPPRNVEGIAVTDLSRIEKQLIREVSTYCSKAARESEAGEREIVTFAMQVIKKRMLSSWHALRKTIDARIEALQGEVDEAVQVDRGELREYQAGLPLGDATLDRVEMQIVKSAVPVHKDRREAELARLKKIRQSLKKIPPREPKVAGLLQYLKMLLLQERVAKVIVFTEYRDTLEAIRTTLDKEPDLAGRYVILQGGMTRKARQRVQTRFEEPDIRLLLATDAASEGLNLQRSCHRIIHIELPWNPNRLEQRNGRVDRYGQTCPPEIRYLFYPDSPEDDILNTLVSKIEMMRDDRVSTPDILGAVLANERLMQELVLLDAGKDGTEAEKARLVTDFDNGAREFIADIRPILVGTSTTPKSLGEIEILLTTKTPLSADDLELERLLVNVLGPDSFFPISGCEGIFRIRVPPAYRGPGVRSDYARVTCRRSVACAAAVEEVEFLTPVHPLVRSIADAARRQLLFVYPDERGLIPKRMAMRRGAGGPAMLSIFYGSIKDGSGIVEEVVMPIHVTPGGEPSRDAEHDARVFEEENSGEASWEEAVAYIGPRFEEMNRAARDEFSRRLRERVEAHRRHRAGLVEELRKDLALFERDRRQEIEEEIRAAAGVEVSQATLAEFGGGEFRRRFDARLAALSDAVRERQEEIRAFMEVEVAENPKPMAAVILLPEVGAQ